MKREWRMAIVAYATIAVFLAAVSLFGQASLGTQDMRDQLRLRYEVVQLRDGVGLVPLQPSKDIRVIEVRNGGVAINGSTVSAREARERLGQDAELVLRITYLDVAAQQNLADGNSTAPATPLETTPNASRPEAELPLHTPTRQGDLVRFGGAVTVSRGEVIEGDVVAIGGPADIDGEVMQEVTVIGGPLTLGPHAIVRRDVTVIGGPLNRSPQARVYGKVDEVGVGSGARAAAGPWAGRVFPFWTRLARVGGLLGSFLRITLLTLGALVVVALGRRFVETIADRAASEPLRAGIAGLLAEVLFLPLLVLTVIVLAVSIIGIPLLFLVPFAVVLVVLLMLVGFTGVACQAGRLVGDRFGIRRGPYVSVALGVFVVVGITLVARVLALLGGMVFGMIIAGPLSAIGYLAEYVAWTVGTGAVILTWLSTRHNAARVGDGATPAPPATQPE